jgi:peptidoglycan/xylan/chitin deacetylase (PgdA/CDA1 family)
MIAEIATSGTVALLAGGAYYAALWPESQLYGRTLLAGANPNEWALTYDDGPNDIHTGRLLEILARHNVRATFFMIGSRVRLRSQIAREVLAAGHCIGNHTVTHPRLMWCSPARVWSELAECNAILSDTLGEQPKFFRPPFGARRPDILRLARALELTPVMWNVHSCDWKIASPDALLTRIEQGIASNTRKHRGSNILMHDGGHLALGTDRSTTVRATELLLEKYSGGEINFVTPERWVQL